MTATLSTLRDLVELHLSDVGNLIFSTEMLDEAIRSALSDLSEIYGSALTLAGLDGAEETTLPEEDEHVLIVGAVAYALTFRASGRFEDAVPDQTLPDAMADWATAHMARFKTMLAGVKERTHQEADQVPYSEWEWDEDA